jgi:hypothetical protein
MRERLSFDDGRDQPRAIRIPPRGRNREQQCREADGEVGDLRMRARSRAYRRLHGSGISAQLSFDACACVLRARSHARRGMGRRHGYGSAPRPMPRRRAEIWNEQVAPGQAARIKYRGRSPGSVRWSTSVASLGED